MASVYTVKWSPQDRAEGNHPEWYLLHDPRTREYQILEPDLKIKKIGAGEFSFTLPPTHPDHAALMQQGCLFDVSVYKNGSFLWAGHPISMETDLYGSCKVTCEGVLGYLSDIRLEPFSITADAGTVFARLMEMYDSGLKQYNSSFPCILHRTFSTACTDGQFPADSIVRRSGKCLTVMAAIREKLADCYGGWMELTESDELEKGMWKLLYHPEPADAITQTLEVGRNILEINRTLDYTDFASALMPVDSGENAVLLQGMTHWDGETDSADIFSPAGSCLYIRRSLADRYGLIVRTYTEDVFDGEAPEDAQIHKAMLAAAGRLAEPSATIEVRAVDLSVIDDAEEAITVGCKVRAILTPGGAPEILTVDSLRLRLDDPTQNTVELNGTLRSFTDRR